jgi:hypothetical protein
MRSRLLVLALPALLALALLASGCGDGGGESSTVAQKPKKQAKPTLTKASFISQGDAICAEVNTAVGGVAESESEPANQTTQIASLYVGMVQSLQQLGQPSETDGFSEFMGAAEELAKTEGEVKAAADQENPELVEEIAGEAGPAVEEFQSQAAVYGFEDCSEGPHAAIAAPTETGGAESEAPVEEEAGGIEVAPEEEAAPEEIAPEEEVAPEVEEVAPEEEAAPEEGGGGAGAIEEAPPEEAAPEGGGIGPE